MPALATRRRTARIRESGSGDGIRLTVNLEKVREGAQAQRVEAADYVKKLLEAKGVKLDKGEDDDLDKKLGVKDGGALDKVLDDATGVEEDGSDLDEAERERREAADAERERRERREDDDAIESMSEAEAKRELRAARREREKLEKDKEKAEREKREAESMAESASEAATRETADRCLREMNIPDAHRGRIRDELAMYQKRDERAIREHIKNYAAAYIRTEDGAGAGALGGGGDDAARGDTSKSLFAS